MEHQRPRIHAIIPAAGAGTRLASGDAPPKQYRNLLGKPMLQWSVERLAAHPRIDGVTVALAEGDRHFDTIEFSAPHPVRKVTGGPTRAHSVLNALRQAIDEGAADWVLVHDAARPCLSRDALDRLFEEGLASPDGAILALPVSDTIKQAGDDNERIARTVDRTGLWAAQTPQLFPARLLETALARRLADDAPPTDEAGAVEAEGRRPRLVAGSSSNLKVTYPGDLALAEAILRRQERTP